MRSVIVIAGVVDKAGEIARNMAFGRRNRQRHWSCGLRLAFLVHSLSAEAHWMASRPTDTCSAVVALSLSATVADATSCG